MGFGAWAQTTYQTVPNAVTVSHPTVEQGTIVQKGVPGSNEQVIEIKKVTTTQKPARKPEFFSLNVAPEYILNQSVSDFWHRDYNTESPGYSVGFNFWFVENFGLNVNYRASVMSSVPDNVSGTRREQVDHKWLDWGLSYKFFTDGSENSAYFKTTLTYSDYEFSAPSSSQGRADLSSDGVFLEFEGGIPVGDNGQFILNAKIAPDLNHDESSNTYTGRSGSSPDAFGIGVGAAFDYKIVMNSSFRVGVNYYEEIDQFSGQTSVVDPVIGSKLTNVEVRNKFQVVQFAYIFSF